MLSDRERETLREIQRQFLVEDRSFVRSFRTVADRSPSDRYRPEPTSPLLVTAALIALLLAGPNLLPQKELADRRRPPAPRRSPASLGHAREPARSADTRSSQESALTDPAEFHTPSIT